jgi:RNA polymerase sigma-70 factor (ECF subfamily)
MDSIDEDRLIQLATAGDGAALATLLQGYESALQRYAARRLPQRVRHIQGPEDIVQDTSFEACRLIRGFVSQGPGSFYRWLVRIANLRILAAIQKHRSRRTHALSSSLAEHSSILAALEQIVLYRRTPSRSAAAHEFVLKIEQSLDRLSEDYRRVITHRFLEGLSVDETAQRMNRNSNHIYVMCSRALGALREQLESASHYA